MFSRSERFVEKIEVTPGPNHYDCKAGEDDPYKRFGFLGKSKRFQDGQGPEGMATGATPRGLYERNGLSASLPSLVIDEDDTQSLDTSSVHSGSTTPDYSRRPPNSRIKSSDKIGQAFAANTNKAEERLKRELSELTERFEKYRIARQKEMDVLNERHKKTENMYQNAIKDKNFIQKQLHGKEAEIAELASRHNVLKTTLEKSEKAATSVNEKISKSNQLQKKIDELEKLLSNAKASLEEQESISSDARQKSDQQVQDLQQQLNEQKELAEEEASQAIKRQRLAQEQHDEVLKKVMEDTEAWRAKFEELEKLVEELKQKLEAEQKTTEELRERMRNEREQLQDQIDRANETIRRMEQERLDLESAMNERTTGLQNEKDDLNQLLQGTCRELEDLKEKHRTTERTLEEQRAQLAETVKTMTQQYEKQQASFSKDRQEHLKAQQDLEQSITRLMTELDQNRNALCKVQDERATLQDKYDQSQSEIQEMSGSMTALKEQYEQLQASSKQEQQEWTAKYKSLSEESSNQRHKADAVIAGLEAKLDKRNVEYGRVVERIDTVQAELKTVERQREEITAQKIEEERKAAKTLERLAKYEQENASILQELSVLEKDKKALEAECGQLKDKAQDMEHSITSLESKVEQITTESKERVALGHSRIKELEGLHLASSKQVEVYQEKEKSWESERTRASADAAKQHVEIEHLQSELSQSKIELSQSKVERDVDSKTSADRIQELENRCRAMEGAFKLLFEKSGSTQVIEGQSDETWKQYSAAVLDILAYHTTECVSKSEHLALLEQKSLLEQSSAAMNAAVQEQESTFKRASTDHASLLAKIAELEDQIHQLNVQVELLEAENIGKEAIIKALQDEYDYQEKKIRDLSKNEDAGKEVIRLEDELRRLTDHTRETDEWIKQVRGDNEKYREAYLKADVAREETLLEMTKLHEQLAESEHTRMQVENQLQVEVSALIKKHGLSPEELSRLSKMNVDSAQNLNLKQKLKQLSELKEENLTLKKKNLALANTRDSLRLKCLQVERDLDAYKAGALNAAATSTSNASSKQSSGSETSCASSVASSSSGSTVVAEQSPSGKLQLQGLVSVEATPKRSRSTSPGSAKPLAPEPSTGARKLSIGSRKLSIGASKPPSIKSRSRSFMAGHPTAG